MKEERREERKKDRRILRLKFLFVYVISKWPVCTVTKEYVCQFSSANSEIFYIFQN